MKQVLALQKMALFLTALIAVSAPSTWSQEQSGTATQSGTSTAKAKPTADEAGTGTSEATEALQKATQNPVASLISVPVQDNTNFGVNPGYRTQNVLNIRFCTRICRDAHF